MGSSCAAGRLRGDRLGAWSYQRAMRSEHTVAAHRDIRPGLALYSGCVDPDRAHQLLARERERIEMAIADLGPEAADEGSEDLYQQEFDAGRAQDLHEQLAAVERAEARLAAGTYGLSVDSGEPIPDERLEALPTAERTVGEQERAGADSP